MTEDKNDSKFAQRCSFCGKPTSQVKRLFSGHESSICNECVELCSDLLHSSPDYDELEEITELSPPAEIKQFLDEYVIGQEMAKKTVSVAVYNHYKRVNHQLRLRMSGKVTRKSEDIELEKSNILLMGQTGTGKTLIARSLAKFLKVPFTIADATVLTEAGYVGEDVENILVRLYQASDYNQQLTERGIIYIDELDKLSRKDGNPSITRDVSGEGVQQGLLKILEGTVANIPPKGGRKHPEQAFVPINTENILFICGGAFDGLEKIVARRIGRKTVGFGSDSIHVDTDSSDIFEHVTPGDLIEYGLIPELVGRLPVSTALHSLDEDALLSILTRPKNALTKQYAQLMEFDGVELRFDPDALKAAVKLAMKRKTGARALRSIFEKALLETMYLIPSSSEITEVIITEKTFTQGEKPRMITKAKSKKAG